MIKTQRSGLIYIYLASDIIAITVSYLCSYLLRFYTPVIPVSPEKGIPDYKSYIIVFPFFLVAHLLIFYIQGFYKTRLKRTRIDDFLFVTLNAMITIFIVWALMNYLYSYEQFFAADFTISRAFLAVYFITTILLISVLRHQIYFVMKRRYARGLNLRSVLIVGAGKMGVSVAGKLKQYKDLGFFVRGFLDDDKEPGELIQVDGGIPVLGPIKDLESILESENISDVYVTLDLKNYPKMLETLQVANKYTVRVRLIPDLFYLLTLKARVEDLDGFPVISIDEPPMRGVIFFMKRVSDYLASGLTLVLLLPLFGIVALVIKLTSKGPVFFHQERVGLDGKKFVIHKFRTMVCDAEKHTGPTMSSVNDSRMTKLGRFLRKFSIDEFPQLINVLKGDMSLIGPRPERPMFVNDFKEKFPKYMLRHKVKSGITGWAQVHGLRQDTPIDKRLEYDIYYIQNWSLALDLKILWKTIRKGFIDRNL